MYNAANLVDNLTISVGQEYLSLLAKLGDNRIAMIKRIFIIIIIKILIVIVNITQIKYYNIFVRSILYLNHKVSIFD